MTDEVADWTGNWDRRPSTSITNLDCQRRTGSTIMIIIVGPMIGSCSVPLLMLLLIVAMIAVMIVGSFNDMCNRFARPLGVEETAGDPFSLGVSGSAGLDEQRRGFGDELLREHAELLGFER